MTWQLWQAVAVQAGITIGLGLIIMIVVAVRHQNAWGSARVDYWLWTVASALVALGAMTGAVAAYVAVGTPT